jgi:hypothetical protein
MMLMMPRLYAARNSLLLVNPAGLKLLMFILFPFLI